MPLLLLLGVSVLFGIHKVLLCCRSEEINFAYLVSHCKCKVYMVDMQTEEQT